MKDAFHPTRDVTASSFGLEPHYSDVVPLLRSRALERGLGPPRLLGPVSMRRRGVVYGVVCGRLSFGALSGALFFFERSSIQTTPGLLWKPFDFVWSLRKPWVICRWIGPDGKVVSHVVGADTSFIRKSCIFCYAFFVKRVRRWRWVRCRVVLFADLAARSVCSCSVPVSLCHDLETDAISPCICGNHV
ncbi:hypothetical protein SCP_1403490 [Sparassis crispa]|uniref:Uncharacterized protein n=1 Tax=Sparassis crispa TaxID=139825 RepID=A0A401H3F3_9APHY|nr:hypothetical protein SCP_1403490 [Sparassis crispa]GBE88941.1 hypothetical protein SCP_1403490 [Sparassis crispa]